MAGKYPETIENIIDVLKSLPGIGRRGAERMAVAMLKWQPDKLDFFSEQIKELPLKVTFCPECGNLAENGELCPVCASGSRDQKIICVVEDFSQVINIESSSAFKGLYHVLGGKLSPLEGKNAEDLTVDQLLIRVEKLDVREVILALSPDVEGQATAIYVAGLLKPYNVKISRLAQGLPAGSDISYADSATIGVALNGRVTLD